MLPEGANAVVRLEHAREVGGLVEIYQPVPPGACVDEAGRDIRAGELALARGTILRAPDIALLLALGLRTVRVFVKPKVGVLSVGDELVDPLAEPTPGPGQVRDVDRPMVMLLIKALGIEPIDLGIAPDRPDDIGEAISKGLSKCHALLTTGGVSVGPSDLVPGVLEGLGAEIIVHRVSMRPGRPIALALLDGKPVICLPGPPVACFLAFQFFARPVLLRLMGVREDRRPLCPTARAKLMKKVPSRIGFTDLVRVRLRLGPDGRLLAEPLTIRGAGILTSLVRANGIVVVPEGVDVLEEGSEVDVHLIGPLELVQEGPGDEG